VAEKRKQHGREDQQSRMEFRRGVREYATPLIAEMLRKQRETIKLPEETLRRSLSMGCIRWGIISMEEEEKFCMSHQDLSERQAIQEEIDEKEATS